MTEASTAERLVVVETKIDAIMGVIDNDLKHMLLALDEKLDKICPAVKENTYWVGVWKKSLFTIAIVGVILGAVATAFYLIKNG